MIIATITALYLLLGGSAIEMLFTDIKKPVKQVIEDKGRRSEILDLSKELGKRLDKNHDQWMDQLGELNLVMQDYHAGPEAFDAVADRLGQTLVEQHQMVFETRAKMKELMSSEEWNAVFSE